MTPPRDNATAAARLLALAEQFAATGRPAMARAARHAATLPPSTSRAGRIDLAPPARRAPTASRPEAPARPPTG